LISVSYGARDSRGKRDTEMRGKKDMEMRGKRDAEFRRESLQEDGKVARERRSCGRGSAGRGSRHDLGDVGSGEEECKGDWRVEVINV